ncbi:hypothetical protein Agub_g12422, partial [Astrephomene gubernaculifera]
VTFQTFIYIFPENKKFSMQATSREPGKERQLLILMKGLPGSGKSTLAAALARALRCPLVDKDDARDTFQTVVRQAPDIDWNALSYDVMFRTAARQLALGLSVVLDCPLSRRQLYEQACEVAARCSNSSAIAGVRTTAATARATVPASPPPPPSPLAAPPPAAAPTSVLVVLVDVECSDEVVWRQRLEARGALDQGTERGHKPASWDELQALLSRYGGSWRWSTDGSVEVPYRVPVCTATASVGDNVGVVLEYLQRT